MDPYVVLDYRGFQEKTPVSEGGGKNPVWNKMFIFSVFRLEEKISLNCFSRSLILDDFIGLAML
jgi:Ca2+-dependent lipid-binding protein